MEKPNLFSIATKELSQDAFITWLLQWADPQYKEVDVELNKLGVLFLRALIAKYDPIIAEKIELKRVKAGRHRDNIDIWVEVNEDIFIIIEDKTNTKEHGKQIEGYVKKAQEYQNQNGKLWEKIVPVYLKTGNECINALSAKINCSKFTRQDFLKVLPVQSSNHIIRDFTDNLQSVEDQTNAYISKTPNEWNWLAVQGFYCDLQRRFKKAALSRGHDGWSEWEYVPNPARGFLGLYWHFSIYKPFDCKIYLLIEGGNNEQPELLLKAGGPKNGQEKLEKDHMYQIFKDFGSAVNSNTHDNIIAVSKAGNYKGGRQGCSVAKIAQKGRRSFIATDKDGLVDMEATTKFLFDVENIVTSVCANAN